MRRRRAQSPALSRADHPEFRHQPFRQLGRLVTAAADEPKPAARTPTSEPPPAPAEGDGVDAFLREVADVRPLDDRSGTRVGEPPPASNPRQIVTAEAEALAELSELVTGGGHFDITDTDEYVEGSVVGIDPRLVRRLHAGEFAHHAHLDLHGLTVVEARVEVDRFLLRSHQSGLRCVLIIHGRGRNSKDQVPVLKQRLVVWLSRGQWSRHILAFATARGCDGGAGALYVLLRRDKKAKHPLRILNGARS
jgi:DNA-nicking Smr family endonuclease